MKNNKIVYALLAGLVILSCLGCGIIGVACYPMFAPEASDQVAEVSPTAMATGIPTETSAPTATSSPTNVPTEAPTNTPTPIPPTATPVPPTATLVPTEVPPTVAPTEVVTSGEEITATFTVTVTEPVSPTLVVPPVSPLETPIPVSDGETGGTGFMPEGYQQGNQPRWGLLALGLGVVLLGLGCGAASLVLYLSRSQLGERATLPLPVPSADMADWLPKTPAVETPAGPVGTESEKIAEPTEVDPGQRALDEALDKAFPREEAEVGPLNLDAELDKAFPPEPEELPVGVRFYESPVGYLDGVKCPNCGKPNYPPYSAPDAEALTCYNCGATVTLKVEEIAEATEEPETDELEKDDLTAIRGIGTSTQKVLNLHGIFTFAQLADANTLFIRNRVRPEQEKNVPTWKKCARELAEAKTAETAETEDVPDWLKAAHE